MAYKFEIVESALVVTNTSNNDYIVIDKPRRDIYYNVKDLQDTVNPRITLHNTQAIYNEEREKSFKLADCIDATDTPFTVNSFITFARENLGFNTASGSSEVVWGTITGDITTQTDLEPYLKFVDGTDPNDAVYISPSALGNVGIETVSPDAKFEVVNADITKDHFYISTADGNDGNVVKIGQSEIKFNFSTPGINTISLSGSATGQDSVNIGYVGFATAIRSINIGRSGEARNSKSINIGADGNSKGDEAINIGYGGDSLGTSSVNIGSFGKANNQRCINIGRSGEVNGDFAINIGDSGDTDQVYGINIGNAGISRSRQEVNIGSFGTDYTPVSAGTFDILDRLFNISSGTSTISRADAFTILKSGKTGIGYSNFETTTDKAFLQVNGGAKFESTTQGIVFPNMTEAQKNAIASPNNGEMIIQTDVTQGLYRFQTGTGWVFIG